MTSTVSFYFGFGTDSPYRDCYVEIQVPRQTLIQGSGLDEYSPRNTAVAIMRLSHGGAWCRVTTTPPPNCARLSLIVCTADGRYVAADVMGDQL